MNERDQDSPMLPLAEAAQRLGRSREAVRSLIRRGRLATVRGNDGKVLVAVPTELAEAADRSRPEDDLADLRERAHEAELAQAEAEAELKVRLEQLDALKAELATRQEQLVELKGELAAARAEVAQLKVELAEARRPWWRRWIGE
jgi:chromosome segregation ATPase